jgi:hypothetical protein
MNALSSMNPRVLAIVAVLVGLILGVAFSWMLWPVPTSVAPVDLHSGYRDYYLEMAAKDYAVTQSLNRAKDMLGADRDRWSSKDIAKALRDLAAKPGRSDKVQLDALAVALDRGTGATPQATPASGGGGNLPLALCLGALLIILLVVGGLWLLPRLRGPKPEPSAAVRSAQATKAVEPTATWAGEELKPLAQFVTKYEIGDDRYDISFSVETPTGDFLGECGVGISETMGTGDPDKVTALEVWLFDKNDIRTVTKVLMSEYAYGNQDLRTKLAPKGEPELARPDAAVELETATLKIRARVTELKYGTGELPPNSFFERLGLELAAWPKEAPAPVAEAAPAA